MHGLCLVRTSNNFFIRQVGLSIYFNILDRVLTNVRKCNNECEVMTSQYAGNIVIKPKSIKSFSLKDKTVYFLKVTVEEVHQE